MNSREWTETGTKLFLDNLNRLSDADLDAPSQLPDWSRKHLVAHLHHNAEALRRLVSWAATGVESRMYASPEQRAAEIESSAQLPAATLRGLVVQSAHDLANDFDALTPEALTRTVITAQGISRTAAEIPYMRAREVCVHSVDLGAGVGFTDLPEDFLAALINDAVAKQRDRAAMAAWLTGRTKQAPALGRWL